MAKTQQAMELYRVHDTLAETTTVIIVENEQVLTRQYVMGYSEQVLSELRKWIYIQKVGIITEAGYVVQEQNHAKHALNDLINQHNGLFI